MLVTPPEKARDISKRDWELIKKHLQQTFEQYVRMFFPSPEEQATITDEWLKVRELAMPAFVSYFHTIPLLYKEQIVERIQTWFRPFDDVIQEKTNLSLYRMLAMVLWVQDQVQKTLSRTFEFKDIVSSEAIRLRSEAEANGWSMEKTREQVKGGSLEKAYWELHEAIDKQFIIYRENMVQAFSEKETDGFLALFASERGAFKNYFYPTETNPAELHPLFQLDKERLFCPAAQMLFLATHRHLEKIMRDSKKRESFLRHRDEAVAQKAVELFRNFLPVEAQVWSSVYETPDGHHEHDILIVYKQVFIIIEAKATQPKEPFRDPERAYTRIKREFHSDTGIQKAYEQANNLKRLLKSQDSTTLYDRRGNVITQIKYSVQEVFCICVTSESYGIVTTDLALLLEKDPNDPYPWAVSLPDLESILGGFKYKAKDIEDLLSFLRQRSILHGLVISTDELEIAGLYLRYGDFSQYLTQKDRKYVVGIETSDIFDEIYFEQHGVPRLKLEDQEQLPVITDVDEELQKMTLHQEEKVQKEMQNRKIGRNEKCPCCSGRKFKKCHGA